MSSHEHSAAVIVVITAVFSYLNYRFFHLPRPIGLTMLALVASLIITGLDLLTPDEYPVRQWVEQHLNLMDFDKTVLQGMLGFLLFAGALQINTTYLHKGRRDVFLLAVVSSVFSTLIIGFLLNSFTSLLGIKMSLPWCFVFGSLISPTDAVAVLEILRRVKVPASMEARIAGESLFNDGVGVVLFSLATAAAIDHQDVSIGQALGLFMIKAVGGGFFGYLLGILAFKSLRKVNDPHIENLITLALVMGGYALAEQLGLSAIVAMAVAGIVIAKYGLPLGMSDASRTYIISFWTTIDEILNSILFVLIGLEVIVVLQGLHHLSLALAAIPLVLLARLVSVSLPLAFKSIFKPFDKGTFPILVWGGMRGGISIALAFSLPTGHTSETVQMMTYAVVVFSVIVQGGTLGYLIRRFYPALPRSENTGDFSG
jgi:CPA1 family monovalent cation:H+ antiporter